MLTQQHTGKSMQGWDLGGHSSKRRGVRQHSARRVIHTLHLKCTTCTSQSSLHGCSTRRAGSHAQQDKHSTSEKTPAQHALHATQTHSLWSEGPHRPVLALCTYLTTSSNSTQQKRTVLRLHRTQRLKKVCMHKAFSLRNQTAPKTRQHTYVPRKRQPWNRPQAEAKQLKETAACASVLGHTPVPHTALPNRTPADATCSPLR